MAWSAPMTAVSGSVFTAAQFNQFVRDRNVPVPEETRYLAVKVLTPGVKSW